MLLRPGAIALPLVVAEVRVGHAGRHDQVVVGDGIALGEDDVLLRSGDRSDGPQHDLDIALAPEDPADRRGDIARAQRCRRHLVEQRLEQVMIVAIDQDHPNRGVAERPRGLQSAEATPDDHDPSLLAVHQDRLVRSRLRNAADRGGIGMEPRGNPALPGRDVEAEVLPGELHQRGQDLDILKPQSEGPRHLLPRAITTTRERRARQ